MRLMDLETGEAIKWLGDTFALPKKESRNKVTPASWPAGSKPKRSLAEPRGKKKPSIIRQILNSPGYAGLGPATVKVGFRLLSLMPEKDPVVEPTQRELRELAGYGDFVPTKKSIEELQVIGVLTVQKHGLVMPASFVS